MCRSGRLGIEFCFLGMWLESWELHSPGVGTFRLDAFFYACLLLRRYVAFVLAVGFSGLCPVRGLGDSPIFFSSHSRIE